MTAHNIMSCDDLSAIKGDVEATRAEIMLGGNPQSTTWLISESPDGKVFTGIWQSDHFHIRKHLHLLRRSSLHLRPGLRRRVGIA